MSPTLLILTAALAAIGVGGVRLLRHRRRRRALYASLAGRRADIVRRFPATIAAADPAALRPTFEAERIQQVTGFLEPATLARLRDEALEARHIAERSFIPGHKKGGTLSYEAVHRSAPRCLALYHSEPLRRWLGAVVGTDVRPTADHDQSSCSLLFYDRPGDHIGWHLDHNFYRGRHFTVLLSLLNRAASGGPGVSAGRLQRRRNGSVHEVPTPENALVAFEGARVLHRATAVGDGEQRVMLSMTFATDPRVHPWKEAARRIKDTAYYGPRVLFD